MVSESLKITFVVLLLCYLVTLLFCYFVTLFLLSIYLTTKEHKNKKNIFNTGIRIAKAE